MPSAEIHSAIELIRNPQRMNRSTIGLLQNAIKQYPYHQALYLLLLENMYKVHDAQFGLYLQKYAVMLADRSPLFEMIEGLNYQIPVQAIDNDADPESDNSDRTLTLIDNFLHSIPDNPQSVPANASDPSSDYSAYLEQLPDLTEPQDQANPPDTAPLTSSPTQKTSLINKEGAVTHSNISESPKSGTASTRSNLSADNSGTSPDSAQDEFTVEAIQSSLHERLNEDDESSIEMPITGAKGKTMLGHVMPVAEPYADANAGNSASLTPASNKPERDYFTEAMAGIYIKQQKFSQALEIIRTLSADNPKKSVYFADQIRYLELLIKLNNTKE